MSYDDTKTCFFMLVFSVCFIFIFQVEGILLMSGKPLLSMHI